MKKIISIFMLNCVFLVLIILLNLSTKNQEKTLEQINIILQHKNFFKEKVLLQSQVNKLNPGMSEEEVFEVLGNGFDEFRKGSLIFFLPLIEDQYREILQSPCKILMESKGNKLCIKQLINFYNVASQNKRYEKEDPSLSQLYYPENKSAFYCDENATLPIDFRWGFSRGSQPMKYEFTLKRNGENYKSINAFYPRFCLDLGKGNYSWNVKAINNFGEKKKIRDFSFEIINRGK